MKKDKTALVLGGGGSRGAYEAGVWQALTELDMHFDMVVGVSVGALNAAMIAQGDADSMYGLWKSLGTDMIFDVDPHATTKDFAKEFVKQGGAGISGLQKLLREFLDEEAVRRSSIEMGLLTTEIPSMKGCPFWIGDIPKGRLADYIIASASAFPAVQYHEIDGHKYIDGGYTNNLPVPMAQEHGAASCVAVYMNAPGRYFPKQAEGVPGVRLIRSKWDLGDFLVFDPENSRRTVRLGYQHAMKEFGVYDGEFFTFIKGSFDKKTLRNADACAQIFALDPLVLYGREHFLDRLADAVAAARADVDIAVRTDHILSLNTLRSLDPAGAKDILRDVADAANRKTLTLTIADYLKNHQGDSLLRHRHIARLLHRELAGAKFLIQAGLA